MARYRVLERSYIGGALVEKGVIVDLEFAAPGQPGPNLEALDAPAPDKPKDVFDSLAE